MAKRIERHGYTIDKDGRIHYDDRPTTIEHIESVAGRRLDRRRSYALVDGEVCESAEWTSGCSGCSEFIDKRGRGCSECGYHGTVRQAMWVPVEQPTKGEGE